MMRTTPTALAPHARGGVCRRLAFNLVEVILALLVIAIALVSVISLMPIGANAARDAVANHHAADSASQILNFYAANLRRNWSLVATLPTGGPYDVSTHMGTGTLPADLIAYTEATPIPGTTGLYAFTGAWAALTTNRVYRIKQSPSNQPDVVDFDAIVRVWKTPTKGWQYDAGAATPLVETTDSGYSTRVQLNVEITWPSQFPFNKRERACYALEVSRAD